MKTNQMTKKTTPVTATQISNCETDKKTFASYTSFRKYCHGLNFTKTRISPILQMDTKTVILGEKY